MAIRVITDSTSYIDDNTLKELDIRVIPLSVHFPDESFIETEVDPLYVYNKITTTGIIPSSSQPSLGQISEVFREFVSSGNDIIAIFLSSAMSGTYSTALMAREEVLKEFPDRKIEVLDSRTNCMALGLQVVSAARAVKDAQNLEFAVQTALVVRDNVHFYFVPETLEYLKKGGRIGTASALLGSLLSIRPILTVDMEKGMTHLWERARGTAKAVERIIAVMKQDYLKHGIKNIVVHHIYAPEKAALLQQKLMESFSIPVSICTIGPVIGLHTGLGTIGIVYCTGN